MRVIRYTDLNAFASRVEPYLVRHEAEHCLPIGILTTSKASHLGLAEEPYMALVEDDHGAVALVALRTPPHNLVLSLLADDADPNAALRGIASDARDACGALPGVIGPKPVAAHFAQIWSALTGERYQVDIEERIYQLRQVIPPRPVSGSMRHIAEADHDLLYVWLSDFIHEALGDGAPDTADSIIEPRLRGGSSGMYIWVDDKPVSIAGFGKPTPHGIRIGPVYTPPDLRGRGYASALVAQTSQRLLDEGRQFCFLFTDLANLTSNHVYQQIGYEPVSDATVYVFHPADQPR
jgi:predicted GNAT family acetyltransferase